MYIAIRADVECSDGRCGHSTRIIVERGTRILTHLVVKQSGFGGSERLVPIAEMASADHDKIVLNISKAQLNFMDPYKSNLPAASQVSSQGGGSSPGTMWEFIPPMNDQLIQGGQRINLSDFDSVASHDNVPEGEAAVSTALHIDATDGRVGSLSELVVDPDTMTVTDFVMRGGHLWGQHEIQISVDDIDYIHHGVVHLNLTKEQVKELPRTHA